MKFKCKDCGKIYNERPQFCECGNDTFSRLKTKAEKEAEELKKIAEENKNFLNQNDNEEDTEEEPEKKEHLWLLFPIIIAIGFFVYYIHGQMSFVEKKSANDHEYLQDVREKMFMDFDPAGITHSGLCIVSFEINEDGWLNKRHFVRKSGVAELDNKVFDMLQKTTIVDKPPKIYTNKPVKLEFGCSANETSVECYSKNIVEDATTQYKK